MVKKKIKKVQSKKNKIKKLTIGACCTVILGVGGIVLCHPTNISKNTNIRLNTSSDELKNDLLDNSRLDSDGNNRKLDDSNNDSIIDLSRVEDDSKEEVTKEESSKDESSKDESSKANSESSVKTTNNETSNSTVVTTNLDSDDYTPDNYSDDDIIEYTEEDDFEPELIPYEAPDGTYWKSESAYLEWVTAVGYSDDYDSSEDFDYDSSEDFDYDSSEDFDYDSNNIVTSDGYVFLNEDGVYEVWPDYDTYLEYNSDTKTR